jgi:hypothetical protein
LNWLKISLYKFFPLKYCEFLRCFPTWFFFFTFLIFQNYICWFFFLILSWLRI